MIRSSQRPLLDNTHNTHTRQNSMPPAGFELAISAFERPQTHALARAGNGTKFCPNISRPISVAAYHPHCKPLEDRITCLTSQPAPLFYFVKRYSIRFQKINPVWLKLKSFRTQPSEGNSRSHQEPRCPHIVVGRSRMASDTEGCKI